jgi:hypothetical protein
MRKIFYTMHFTGQSSRNTEHAEMMRTTGSATSCVVTTRILRTGVDTSLKAAEGDLAFLESQLQITGQGTYQESGEISFGDEGEHVLRFSTLGQGHMAKDLEPGVMAGTASWKVEGGEGQFAKAAGFITSTFTINESGERSDFHCGLIFLPDEKEAS